MCFAALSFVGGVVYAALNEDGKEEIAIARGITLEQLNPLLIRGPVELVPGVRREEGRELLALMGKLL
ncbi:tRNA(adenine34) deaminase [Thermosporothrix hazakensis]|jgi:tRNA(adenine34) deaminase|uniref:tRNA(Adenine34) deaminase n=2 Tax=Thermosporothrix TaxID=768650 RepID=A0A326UBN5_THEHA|nr:hypothetical protein [Thermosporothrix hazakensis]PZW34510.1 tRNA(adenine34) deaminase [Thermosporothrix hazakensis]BBH85632.1 hypothetical protein KTC_03830 [Thermosporothrix sp. COM3]GCE45939.1 hypothetical protein KTH_08080 [Thermosporothrix hazakensis]